MASGVVAETTTIGKAKTFRETADYRIRPHGVRVLLTPISWDEHFEQPDTRTFTAPAGMVHDGATIPIVLSFLNGPSIQLAATLHDAAYRFQAWDNGEAMTRWEADRIIREAARACQERAREKVQPTRAGFLSFTHLVQRWVIWIGLLPGGILAWRRSPSKRGDFDPQALGDIENILKALRLATRVVPADAGLAETAAEQEKRQTWPPSDRAGLP